ncbi:unnamed protein product [Trichogramma brassicae]|uniref:Uncharacterized protein n=1 Tax=Trichogramma brassicae TaxID=86971 RepID=A0A6H5IPA0_9HYME|nr:unnamed protein product [Trichogramma brassicae]
MDYSSRRRILTNRLMKMKNLQPSFLLWKMKIEVPATIEPSSMKQAHSPDRYSCVIVPEYPVDGRRDDPSPGACVGGYDSQTQRPRTGPPDSSHDVEILSCSKSTLGCPRGLLRRWIRWFSLAHSGRLVPALALFTRATQNTKQNGRTTKRENSGFPTRNHPDTDIHTLSTSLLEDSRHTTRVSRALYTLRLAVVTLSASDVGAHSPCSSCPSVAWMLSLDFSKHHVVAMGSPFYFVFSPHNVEPARADSLKPIIPEGEVHPGLDDRHQAF